MCPFCKHKDRECKVTEKPNGRLMCDCGKHSWPNTDAYLESCRRASLTTVRMVHEWTQAH